METGTCILDGNIAYLVASTLPGKETIFKKISSLTSSTAYKSPQLILSLYPYISSQDLGLWKTNQSQPTSQK